MAIVLKHRGDAFGNCSASGTSLLIGVAFLAVSLLLGDVIGNAFGEQRLGEVLRESLLIGGWVAMWRPMEIFLYDWWPIRAEAALFDRLSAMPVRTAYTRDTKSEAWRWDWPAVSPTPTEPAKPSSHDNV